MVSAVLLVKARLCAPENGSQNNEPCSFPFLPVKTCGLRGPPSRSFHSGSRAPTCREQQGSQPSHYTSSQGGLTMALAQDGSNARQQRGRKPPRALSPTVFHAAVPKLSSRAQHPQGYRGTPGDLSHGAACRESFDCKASADPMSTRDAPKTCRKYTHQKTVDT